jgi:hypothetical protein
MGRLLTLISRGHKQFKDWEEEMDGNCLLEGSPGLVRSYSLLFSLSKLKYETLG